MDSTLQTSNNTSSISEQKYINLRKRLDQLGYRQTLGIESLPLIEKLFNDLVHTTESLKKSKLEVRNHRSQILLIKIKKQDFNYRRNPNLSVYRTVPYRFPRGTVKVDRTAYRTFLTVFRDFFVKAPSLPRFKCSRSAF
jgi:hypothetical protein